MERLFTLRKKIKNKNHISGYDPYTIEFFFFKKSSIMPKKKKTQKQFSVLSWVNLHVETSHLNDIWLVVDNPTWIMN